MIQLDKERINCGGVWSITFDSAMMNSWVAVFFIIKETIYFAKGRINKVLSPDNYEFDFMDPCSLPSMTNALQIANPEDIKNIVFTIEIEVSPTDSHCRNLAMHYPFLNRKSV